MGVSQIDKIDYIVEKTLEGNVVRFLENKTLPSLLLPKIRRNKFKHALWKGSSLFFTFCFVHHCIYL